MQVCEDRASNNLDTGPPPKTLTRSRCSCWRYSISFPWLRFSKLKITVNSNDDTTANARQSLIRKAHVSLWLRWSKMSSLVLKLHFITFLQVSCTHSVTLIHEVVYEVNQSFLCWLTSTIDREAFGSLVKVGCFELRIRFLDVWLLWSIAYQEILSLKWSSKVFLLNKSHHIMMTILLRIPDNSKIYIENCINSPSQYVQNQIKTKSFQITNDTKFNILNRFFKIWMSVQCYIEFDMFISIGSYF